MKCKYDIDIDKDVILFSLKRITSQTYRLLPAREENQDWIKPLETLTVEIAGMSSLFQELPDLFSLFCKMQGMIELGEKLDFKLFRRSIFECCGILNKIEKQL